MKKIILIIAIVLMLFASTASAKFIVTSDGKYIKTSDGKYLVTSDHTGGDPYGGNNIIILKFFIME